ncbi:MAG: hypothetical protein JOY98_03965 [Candidatus Eremiobacteraeota bacterium]|nr:hypothetical protein [Candidatus Eremiobacteraeota bacterium]
MPRKPPANIVQPAFPPDRALAAFKRQLEALQNLKGRSVDEATADEDEWENLAQSLVERTFGNPSSNLNKFYTARNAGYHNLMGVSDYQRQQNYNERIQAYESAFRSFIAELQLSLPEEDIGGAYAAGEEYELYRDLSKLIEAAAREVFIADAYVDEKTFNLYVSKAQTNITVRILTNNVGSNVETVARMYAVGKPLEFRTSKSFHDRVVFVDDRGWVVGQSLKDAATKKPTYMIELEEPILTVLRKEHQVIWQAATVII